MFAEGEPDNRGKWAVPCTPIEVAHGPGRCCPWQAEASGLSQPRLHVAGTLLFVLVPRVGGVGLPRDPRPKLQALDGTVPCLGRAGSTPHGSQAPGLAQVSHKFQRGAGRAPGMLKAGNPGEGNPRQAWLLIPHTA